VKEKTSAKKFLLLKIVKYKKTKIFFVILHNSKIV